MIPDHILSRFPKLTNDQMYHLLKPPTGPVRMILDTDTANEIDDQFALAWALLSPDQIKLEGITTEPFSFQHHQSDLALAKTFIETGPQNAAEGEILKKYGDWAQRLMDLGKDPSAVNFTTPEEGEELSYQEILHVYEKLGMDPGDLVFRGSPTYLTSLDEPIRSPSAEHIIERALAASEQPLYVSAIGCVTNVASALLMEPEIIKNMVVIWTSAFPSRSHRSNEPSLNLVQDRLASQLLFECGVAHVYLPGYHIGAQLSISLPEMEKFVRGKGAIGDYLYHLFTNNPIHEQLGITDISWRTWIVWDMINIAWLLNPDWVPTDVLTSPQLDDQLLWRNFPNRHLMREAYDINRDAIYHDFFQKLENAV